MAIFRRRHIFILVHLFCWLIFAFGILFSRPGEWKIDTDQNICDRQFVLLGILVCVFYVNMYVLIPRLLLKKKVAFYILTIIGIIVLFSLLNKLSAHLFYHHDQPGFPKPFWPHHDRGIDTYTPGMILLMVGLGVAISFIQKWQEELQLRQQLEKEKVTSELSLLKAQINPHFFFNTLNTIYSYTETDGNIARTAITNLSKMMRYVLYESEGDQTPLSHEIAFIKEYVELMRLRISPRTTVKFDVYPQPVDAMIAPMIFLPFIENAFKHGVSNSSEAFIYITIVQQRNNTVELTVSNSIHERKIAGGDKSSGIGIHNTRRRLELLYPGKYELHAGEKDSQEYLTRLKLSL